MATIPMALASTEPTSFVDSSITLPQTGEAVLIIGEYGCGKSTAAAKMIQRDIKRSGEESITDYPELIEYVHDNIMPTPKWVAIDFPRQCEPHFSASYDRFSALWRPRLGYPQRDWSNIIRIAIASPRDLLDNPMGQLDAASFDRIFLMQVRLEHLCRIQSMLRLPDRIAALLPDLHQGKGIWLRKLRPTRGVTVKQTSNARLGRRLRLAKWFVDHQLDRATPERADELRRVQGELRNAERLLSQGNDDFARILVDDNPYLGRPFLAVAHKLRSKVLRRRHK